MISTTRYNFTTTNYPIKPIYPTAIWPDYQTSTKSEVIQASTGLFSLPIIPDVVYKTTTGKHMDIKTSTETVAETTVLQYTDAVPVERLTTVDSTLQETSTADQVPLWPTTMGLETTPPVWEMTSKASIVESDLELVTDRECGVTKGCFDDCRDGVCNYIISWKPERFSTRFEIRTRPSMKGPYWAAIGFSDDRMMVCSN